MGRKGQLVHMYHVHMYHVCLVYHVRHMYHVRLSFCFSVVVDILGDLSLTSSSTKCLSFKFPEKLVTRLIVRV